MPEDSKSLTSMKPISPHPAPWGRGSVIPVFQIKKLRREVMPSRAHGHAAGGAMWTAQRPRARVALHTCDSGARPRAHLSCTVGGRQAVLPLSPNTLDKDREPRVRKPRQTELKLIGCKQDLVSAKGTPRRPLPARAGGPSHHLCPPAPTGCRPSSPGCRSPAGSGTAC